MTAPRCTCSVHANEPSRWCEKHSWFQPGPSWTPSIRLSATIIQRAMEMLRAQRIDRGLEP